MPTHTTSHAPKCRVAVVIDFQNMVATGHQNFRPEQPRGATHTSLLDPVALAETIIATRTAARAERFGGKYHPCPEMEITDIVVARSLPSPRYSYKAWAYNMAHTEKWTTDPRVRVLTTPMKYREQINDRGVPYMRGKESGVDTLAALETLVLAAREDIDLVVLATHDHDIDPGVIYARRVGGADVETAGWVPLSYPTRSVDLVDDAGRSVWRTFLDRPEFEASRDHTDYTAIVESA